MLLRLPLKQTSTKHICALTSSLLIQRKGQFVQGECRAIYLGLYNCVPPTLLGVLSQATILLSCLSDLCYLPGSFPTFICTNMSFFHFKNKPAPNSSLSSLPPSFSPFLIISFISQPVQIAAPKLQEPGLYPQNYSYNMVLPHYRVNKK